jgi:excisionase family DNA binding protein
VSSALSKITVPKSAKVAPSVNLPRVALSIGEFAYQTGYGYSTVYRMVHENPPLIKSVKMGSHNVRIPISELEKFKGGV